MSMLHKNIDVDIVRDRDVSQQRLDVISQHHYKHFSM